MLSFTTPLGNVRHFVCLNSNVPTWMNLPIFKICETGKKVYFLWDKVTKQNQFQTFFLMEKNGTFCFALGFFTFYEEHQSSNLNMMKLVECSAEQANFVLTNIQKGQRTFHFATKTSLYLFVYENGHLEIDHLFKIKISPEDVLDGMNFVTNYFLSQMKIN